jgi:hypothetical protein
MQTQFAVWIVQPGVDPGWMSLRDSRGRRKIVSVGAALFDSETAAERAFAASDLNVVSSAHEVIAFVDGFNGPN